MEKKYIYNKVQALFYINEYKCKVIDVGVHKKTLNPYIVFDKDDTEEAYTEWCKRCEKFKNK